MRSALERGRHVGVAGADLVTSGVEDAVRVLVERRIDRAIRHAPTTVDTSQLVAALEPSSSFSSLAGRAGTVGRRVARHTRAARVLSRRTPTGMALRWGPLLVDAVRGHLRAVDAVAVHLVSRARRAGVDPDPGRVHAAVVQVLAGLDVEPEGPADHAALARTWLRDSGRKLLPFGLVGSGRGRSAADVVGRLVDLDVGRLGRR